jgi:hypothetical protein
MNRIITLFLLFVAFQATSQVPQYRAINATLLINATKDGQAYRFTNKNILVSLDYQVGNFMVSLSNRDFYMVDSVSNNTLQDTITRQQFTLSGVFPINDIIGQQMMEQSYDVELQLVNSDLNIDQTLNMKLTVTVPNASGQANYRIFNLSGTLDNDQLQLPAFSTFDNLIQIWIQFGGIATSN